MTTFTFVGGTTGTTGQAGGIGGLGGGFSDGRLKTNVQPLKYGLQTVQQLSPVRYNWADSADVPLAGNERAAETRSTVQPSKVFGRQAEVGLIAQQVEALVPEVVSSDDATGFKRLSYDKLVPVLINAVQELSAENEQFKSEIKEMKARLDKAGM